MPGIAVRVVAVVFIVMGLDLASAGAKAASPAPSGDCCSPAAMKQIADSSVSSTS